MGRPAAPAHAIMRLQALASACLASARLRSSAACCSAPAVWPPTQRRASPTCVHRGLHGGVGGAAPGVPPALCLALGPCCSAEFESHGGRKGPCLGERSDA